jgi:predicted Zn finger-like uncharacterized protein
MTDSFVTQCPHCQTSFRVSYHQLSAARGAVRCGSCLQVFNAARQLLEQSQGKAAGLQVAQNSTAPVAEPQAPAAPIPPSAVEPAEAAEAAEAAPPYRRVEPISQRRWAAAAEIDLEHLDLDDELARLERRQGNGDSHSPQGNPLSARRDEREHQAFDEPRLGDIDDGQTDEPGALRADRDYPDHHAAEPDDFDLPLEGTLLPPVVHDQVDSDDHEPRRAEPSLTRLEDEFDEHARLHPVGAPRETPARQRRSAIEDADESLRRLDAPPLKPAARPKRAEPRMRDDELPDLSEDPLQLQWQKTRTSWGRRLLWTALSLLAAVALAGQYVAYHFDELARQDAYRPWFQQLCPMLGCDVPSKVDIALIKSSNLVVRSHPQFSGALVVDAIIYNRAPFSQPFPLLELRFADLDGKLIASRRFKPSEYLSGDLAGQTDMPPQTPIHIALDILDPGSKAVNYSLSFQSPE